MKKSRILSLTAALLLSISTSALAASIGYLGPAGTFTEEVTKKYFTDTAKNTYTPGKNIADTLQLLSDGKVEYAVVPKENSLGGVVYMYLDQVLGNDKFVVVQELNLPIRQQLFSLPDAQLSDIKTVYSHPQGIAQARTWLNRNLPNAKLIETSSTAEGVRLVEEKQDKSIAAIAGPQAGEIYKVKTLAEDTQITRKNVTRFLVVKLSEQDKIEVKGQKAMVYVKIQPEDLITVLDKLSKGGYSLTAIHDRPAKTVIGEYNYVLELSSKGDSSELNSILKKSIKAGSYTIKGVYDAVYY